jgi:indole-3-glycerol phosphate synthase
MSGFTPYDLNALNNFATKNGIKPLTLDEFSKMTPKERKNYVKIGAKTSRVNRRDFHKFSKDVRKNAKLTASENLKQAQLMHGTIRQGLIEMGALGAQAIGQGLSNSNVRSISSAIKQNTDGGTSEGDYDVPPTEKGPVASVKYSYNSRKED